MPDNYKPNPEKSSPKEWYLIRWPFKLIKNEVACNNFSLNSSLNDYWECGWHQEQDQYESHVWHDADGWMTIKVVSRHKPTPRHMERCFVYNRLYDPFGQPIASATFKCITEGHLKKYIAGHVPAESDIIDSDFMDRMAALEPFIQHHETLKEVMDFIK